MFSPELMKFLINYQKDDFKPVESKKEIPFDTKHGKRLAEIFLTINE